MYHTIPLSTYLINSNSLSPSRRVSLYYGVRLTGVLRYLRLHHVLEMSCKFSIDYL